VELEKTAFIDQSSHSQRQLQVTIEKTKIKFNQNIVVAKIQVSILDIKVARRVEIE